VVICLQRGADLHVAQLMPLQLTVSCFSKIQIGFTFLVPAHPGSPGKGPLNGCSYYYGHWICPNFKFSLDGSLESWRIHFTRRSSRVVWASIGGVNVALRPRRPNPTSRPTSFCAQQTNLHYLIVNNRTSASNSESGRLRHRNVH